MNGEMVTAKELSLIACRSCHLLSRPPGVEESAQIFCPRCGAPLHSRKPNSIARTWALVLAAYVLYLPANLFPITEAVGRWSMLDVYVVSILVALVALGAFASIEAGLGAVFFASVVVTTMFAAMSFDPRLIWDERE